MSELIMAQNNGKKIALPLLSGHNKDKNITFGSIGCIFEADKQTLSWQTLKQLTIAKAGCLRQGKKQHIL